MNTYSPELALEGPYSESNTGMPWMCPNSPGVLDTRHWLDAVYVKKPDNVPRAIARKRCTRMNSLNQRQFLH